MIEITFIEADGNVRNVSTEPAGTLMAAALSAGIGGILAECGGNCCCGTCHVYVDPQWCPRLPGPADDECDMLSLSDAATGNSRLACQIALSDRMNGLSVSLPRRQGQ